VIYIKYVIRMLHNKPGSGKTRFLLECLCQRFGIYLSCMEDGFGSDDFREALQRIRVQVMPVSFQKGDEVARHLLLNDDIVLKYFGSVLLSRLLIMEAFIKALPEKRTDEHRRLWLLAQTHPKAVFGYDLPAQLYRALTLRYNRPAFHSEMTRISDALRKSDKLFYVLDAAQGAAELHPGAFRGANGEPRAVLKHLVRVITRSCTDRLMLVDQISIVVSGTDNFSKSLDGELPHPLGKPDYGAWKEMTDLGGFYHPAHQAEYLMGYLWPRMRSIDNLTDNQRSLTKRAWDLLAGR
jgi:hypothetical protein